MRRHIFAIPVLVVAAHVCLAQGTPQVTITSIDADASIKGTVSNLPSRPAGTPCIVIYVHTDVWYIHPYADAGAGKSYALVNPQGNWTIETVKREFPANKVAAMAMGNANDCGGAPARVADISKIQNVVAQKVYDLKGDAAKWYRLL